MKFGRARFYADENVDHDLITWLRGRKFRVQSAQALGYKGRDDRFHLQEAARRKCVLLTNDRDYLDHSAFPFSRIKRTAIIVLGTQYKADSVEFGYMLLALGTEIAVSGTKNLWGLKVELRGPRMVFHAVVRGRIRRDEIDISRPLVSRTMFEDADE